MNSGRKIEALARAHLTPSAISASDAEASHGYRTVDPLKLHRLKLPFLILDSTTHGYRTVDPLKLHPLPQCLREFGAQPTVIGPWTH